MNKFRIYLFLKNTGTLMQIFSSWFYFLRCVCRKGGEQSDHRIKYVREANENKNEGELDLPSHKTSLPDERNPSLFSTDKNFTMKHSWLPSFW